MDTCRENGKKNWVFADGDLPPKDGGAMEAHEALMVTNLNDKPAHIELRILFEDKPPVVGLNYTIEGMRVNCIRMDHPLGEQGFKVPFGQYAVHLISDDPVVAVFGRLDTRQPNMAYYSTQGYSFG